MGLFVLYKEALYYMPNDELLGFKPGRKYIVPYFADAVTQ